MLNKIYDPTFIESVMSYQQILSYTPGLSTIYGVFLLVIKNHVISDSTLYFNNESQLYHRVSLIAIDQKSYIHCITLLIPVIGNVVVFVGNCLYRDFYQKLKKINDDPQKIMEINCSTRHYFDLVLAAVKKGGVSMSDLSGKMVGLPGGDLALINNPDILEASIKHKYTNYAFGGKELKEDKQFTLKAININPRVFTLCCEDMKSDKEVAELALSRDGNNLSVASSQFRDDIEMVKIAVSQNGESIKFASDKLKNDVGLFEIALKKGVAAIKHAGPEIKNNKKIGLQVVKVNGQCLQYLDPNLQNDADLVTIAVNQDPKAMKFASSELKKDKKFVMERIQNAKTKTQKKTIYDEACLNLRSDQDVKEAAVLT